MSSPSSPRDRMATFSRASTPLTLSPTFTIQLTSPSFTYPAGISKFWAWTS